MFQICDEFHDVDGDVLEKTAVKHGHQEQKNVDCCPLCSTNQCLQGDANISKLIVSNLVLDLNSRSM